jgi:hypothetical protein
MEGLYIFAGILSLIGIFSLASMHFDKKRSGAIETSAVEMGLMYQKQDGGEVMRQFAAFRLFGTGRHQTISNVIDASTDDLSLTIFDYRYTTGHGKNKKRHKQSVVALRAADLSAPQFHARPEHLFDWVGNAIGRQDIDFAEDPKFSKSFVLQGDDESLIRTTFVQPVRDQFMVYHPCIIEGNGDALIYYKPGKLGTADTIKPSLEIAFTLYKTFCRDAQPT